MPTLNELSRRIMKRLSLLQASEQPTSQDAADINAVQTSEHAAMLEEGLIKWPLDAIPVHSEEAWINYIAAHVSPDFGADEPIVLARGDYARKRLISLSAEPEDPRDTPVTDY